MHAIPPEAADVGGRGEVPPTIFSEGGIPPKIPGRKKNRRKNKEKEGKSRKMAKLLTGSKQMGQN